MKPLLLILLLSSGMLLWAQTSDSFSDGDFSQNPSWYGDDSLFVVNAALQLQSKGATAKEIALATASAITVGEWRFLCRLNLSPSTSNLMRVYIMSDSSNLKAALNGYYVQLGGVTGSSDSITLYKQKGLSRVRIIGGRAATVSKSNNTVRVKVLRDAEGNWQLFSDTSGGNNYVLEGTGFDQEFFHSSNAGVFVKYTSSYAQGYFFDDWYAGEPLVDTMPPTLDSVQVVSATQLRLVFSEDIQPQSLSPSLFFISNGIGNPLSVQFESGKRNVLVLNTSSFVNGSYTISLQPITDEAGNQSEQQQQPFLYNVWVAGLYDVLISEWMPDPTPAVDLPEQEFIELYNTTDSVVQLKGWTLSDGTTTAILPHYLLLPHEFVIVCAQANAAVFSQLGPVVSISSWPSLNNTADHIQLRSPEGIMIHDVAYDLSWYQNIDQSTGGYSIELCYPQQLCKGKSAYSASINTKGGTPGKLNSVWVLEADTIAPLIKMAATISDHLLLLVFSENMDSLSMMNCVLLFTPENAVLSREVLGNDSLLLTVNASWIPKQLTTLFIEGVNDCSGNKLISSNEVLFMHVVTDTAYQYDVLIHEVMCDPDPIVALPNAEYIELYNRSDKLISIHNWTLSDGTNTAVLPSYLLWPDSMVLVVSKTEAVLFAGIANCIGVSSFPSLGNDGDDLVLKDSLGFTIHHLLYTSDAYQSSVKKEGGWSLELMDKNNPCGFSQNMLASKAKEGGTPGKKNSVQRVKEDKQIPKWVSAYVLNAHEIELRLNEDMDSTSQNHKGNYVLDGRLNPVAFQFKSPDYKRLKLIFEDSIKQRTIYALTVTGLKDCAGNTMEENTKNIGLAEEVLPGDIVINEILFDPKGDGSDFVEVYNRSQKVIDLKTIYIANANEDGIVKDFTAIDTTGLCLFPHTYMVFTEDPINIRQNYQVRFPENLIAVKLPAYSNTSGTCILLDKTGLEYDRFDYSDELFFPLLDNPDGVSLERIDFNRPVSDPTNWTSASSTSGYATPTFQNSQYVSVQSSGMIHAEPEVFSPDGDGWNDELHFRYQMESGGFTANLTIYDASGKRIKQLLRNELLGTEGVVSWNGIDDNGNKANIGIYVCYFEAFQLSGKVVKKRLTAVVGGKL